MCQDDRKTVSHNTKLKEFALHLFGSAFVILILISLVLWCASYAFNLVKVIRKGKADDAGGSRLWHLAQREARAYNQPRRLQKIMNGATGKPAQVEVDVLLPLGVLALAGGGYCIFEGEKGTIHSNKRRVVEFAAAYATEDVDEETWVARAQAYIDQLAAAAGQGAPCTPQVLGFVPFDGPNWRTVSSLDLCPCFTETVQSICRRQKQHGRAVGFKVQVGVHNHAQFVMTQKLARRVNSAAFWKEQNAAPALPADLAAFREKFESYMRGARGKCGGGGTCTFAEFLGGGTSSTSPPGVPSETEVARLQAWWQARAEYRSNAAFNPSNFIQNAGSVVPAIPFCYPFSMQPSDATMWWSKREAWSDAGARRVCADVGDGKSEIYVRDVHTIRGGAVLLALGAVMLLWVAYGVRGFHPGTMQVQHRELYFVPPRTAYLKTDTKGSPDANQVALEEHIRNRKWWHTPFERCLFWWHQRRPLAQLSKDTLQKGCDYVDMGSIIQHNVVILFFVLFTEMFFLYGVTLHYDSLDSNTVRGIILTKILEFIKSGRPLDTRRLVDQLLEDEKRDVARSAAGRTALDTLQTQASQRPVMSSLVRNLMQRLDAATPAR